MNFNDANMQGLTGRETQPGEEPRHTIDVKLFTDVFDG